MTTPAVVPSNDVPSSSTSAVVLDVPDRALLVVAGLPGAGKTTLVRRLAPTPGVVGVDAEDVALALAGLRAPYRLVRPLVHLLHLLRRASDHGPAR